MSDITIKVKDREGEEKEIIAPTDFGFNLMEMLKSYDYPIQGTCGGMALCASCHVYVHSDHELPEQSEDEEDMLDQAFFVEDNSRLACQLPISEKLEGLEVEIAPESE